MTRKFFTIEEANRLLPTLAIELSQLRRIQQQLANDLNKLQHMRTQDEQWSEAGEDDPFFELETAIEFAQLEARTHLANVQATGAQLKDIDLGLVDFPAWKDGVEVLLCWRLGEAEIGYWHSLESGFSGRKPIVE